MYRLGRSRALASAFSAPKVSPSARLQSIAQQQRRALSIHEYRSADLLRQYGIDLPKGSVATTAAEAEAVAKNIGTDDMVIKAQVLAGGRGKGSVSTKRAQGRRARHLLADRGQDVRRPDDRLQAHHQADGRRRPSVQRRLHLRAQVRPARVLPGHSHGPCFARPVIVSSSQGGMDIEGVAKENPDAITTTHIDINVGVTDEIARGIATKLGFSEQCIEDAKDTIKNLYTIFLEKDATQIEINPLSETSDHKVMCMDAKFGFDDNADFRQKEVFEWRDTTQEDPEEVRAAEAGLNFIKLDGDIGCLVNGAGLAMATMDIIKLNGGQPANFLDVGGGATPAAIKEAFELITSDPKVTAIFVNIFGGIVRCDAIAHGLINTVKTLDLKIPIIARLQGTNMEQAHQLINESGMKIFSIDDLQSAAERAVQLSKVVKMARDIDVGVEFTLGI
ncbi:hypothetical protein CHGG_07834 [Chaetomium globosum CBS 148.51]|uniref:Succinate--CoA ligase [ADP-forming] subunit beta, mitochondrial n=1 Tax=Chaetomium globosum (strain ATCC 6205 / CBS 148.51 / DSM 1962 / NBRC 6347 / NRRL 1970) TaxID=306901 RepID=Q2GW20_CHAGB|nr:uncharacterized protein CHGG_07834 [Chaetomium globosum CBS 148.51]EAQ86581.1 hypothetical protein CHGG_07834 [Chaetomium globosum CBS 148.51]